MENAASASRSPRPAAEAWTMRALVARHKLGASVAAASIALMLALILVAALGPKAGAVRDGTSCTQWGSANLNAQTAYAMLYVREHGALRGRTSPAKIVALINTACTQAYVNDVSDTTSIVQALSGRF